MSFLSSAVKFFEGRVTLYADKENKDALMSFFLARGIKASVTPDEESGGIYTEISVGILKKIALSLDKLNIMVYINNIYGFKRFSSRYGKRYGLMLGGLLFAALLWASTLFVWRVDISGTDRFSRDEIREELSEMGVRVGCRISDIDKTGVAGALLKEHPELSWAALNLNGTTVSLVLKETEERPSDIGNDAKWLVASEGGVIKSVLVYEGAAAVKVGTVVKKGDVLITGLISGSGMQITENPPLRVTNAKGSVKAEVVRTVSVNIPFSEETEMREKGGKIGRTVSVFGHSFTFGSTDGAVTEEKHITFFGAVEIPVTVKSYFSETVTTKTVITDGERAQLLAEKELYKRITEVLGDGELTFVKTEYTETESGVEGYAEIGCVTEIAVPEESEK